MKITIVRIENRIVTCSIDKEPCSFIDIARRWLAEDIQEGDTIEINIVDN